MIDAAYPSTLSKKTVLVLGLGDTGMATVRWLARQGAAVRVADTRTDPPHAETLHRDFPHISLALGPFSNGIFRDVDLVVASPGVPLADPEVAAAVKGGLEVVGDVELFARTLQSMPNPPRVVAITGANGKTTVTTMVGEMVKAAGLDVQVLGNIGTPVLEALSAPKLAQVYVLELSSFQLETTHSLELVAATVLNVTEDHMDRYPDMAAYIAAKARIFKHCGRRVLNREDAASMGMAVPGSVTFGLNPPPTAKDWGVQEILRDPWICRGNEAVMSVNSLQLTGWHNVANAMAALAICDALAIPQAAAIGALQTFKGLPHRVEWVGERGGVDYYDDSKGTNVGATVAALLGMNRPVVLIAGGDGKGQDFSPLAPALKAHARAMVLIGRDGPLIEAAVAGCGIDIERAADMDDAVQRASRLAKKGDAVMLSPACASFDMFRGYVHRAEVFVAAVKALPPLLTGVGQ
jgi:UDP-N-acetylmuramoylalanine--D-glutamate ligase